MSRLTTDGSRIGQTRAELELLMAGTAFAPARARAAEARELLERDGAVILCGLPPQPDSLVMAAAEVLGTRLSRLYPVRERHSDRDDLNQLHNDSHRVEVDVHGQTVALRDPDEDYVLIQCVHRAASGGASFIADGYRVVDRLRDAHPGLWDFLTTVDVDFYGAWNPHRGVPNTPQVCRHVEWTRAGRRVVRANQGARPIWRGRAVHETMAQQQEAMLDLFADIRAAVTSDAPRTVLENGEILLIDNYRCWHGRDAHDTPRLINIMTVRTTDAM
ncbi:MAG: TauD/TfdA family dioxygenase [Pseudonocardiaceae bacterium]